jgi:ankyrin repeat protein
VSPNNLGQDDVQDTAISRLDGMDASADAESVVVRPSASPTGPLSEAEGAKETTASTPSGIRSSPPVLTHDVEMDLDAPEALVEDTGGKSDSEAETIVLPGHSPSKIRKSIKHEDKSDDEAIEDAIHVAGEGGRNGDGVVEVEVEVELDQKPAEGKSIPTPSERKQERERDDNAASTSLGKRKRPKHSNGLGNSDSNSNGNTKIEDPAQHGNSSGLSSVPHSPIATNRSSLSKSALSGSSRSPSPHSNPSRRHKAKSVDRVLPRQKQYGAGSGEEGEGEARRFNRHRSSGVENKQSRDKISAKNADSSSRKHDRSISPPSRSHRRSISTQLPPKSTHGLSHKKKRVPAPLQSTEYQSDDSSESGNSHPRSSRLRHLAAPTTGDSAISPAKMAPHKKHVNSSGQTLVARACASGKLDIVKQRLDERPEDLNEGDHAQNTPLHTASIAGHANIVKFLLAAGCVVDPVNVARDTPLHDAIDNGHLDVVRLLLDAGANPRKANGKGEDPYDLVEEDTDVTDEMRDAITQAKQRTSDVRRLSDDEQMHDNTDGRLSHPKGSPRQTPPIQSHESMVTSRRNASTRAVKTSDRVLYQPLNLSELRRAAGQNDTSTVVRILDVHNNNLNDAKSLIIAAKAGHHDVINLLFGYGEFNPDPEALDNQPPESSTPILAAIGRENLEVLKLFLNQGNFDPTKRVNGETYYEIAKRRGGSVWKEEEALLKNAYDKYKKSHKSPPGKPRSPGLRRDGRETEREPKPISRKEDQQPSRSHKRATSSPRAKNIELEKSTSTRTNQSSDVKRGPGRPRKEEKAMSADLSDHENTPLGLAKQKPHTKKPDLDHAVASSENEAAIKPRRKLISGKEFRGERDLKKQRRSSITSTTSSASTKEKRDEVKGDKIVQKPGSSVSRIGKATSSQEPDAISEKFSLEKDRARSLKRDDSKDRLSAIRGESPVKRPRQSETPPRSGMHEVTSVNDGDGGPQKRRKLDGDSKMGNKTESISSSSPDHRTAATKSASHERTQAKSNSETRDKDKSARSTPKRVKSPERRRHSQPSDEKKSTYPTPTSDLAKPTKHDNDKAPKDTAEEAAEAAALAVKAEEELELERLREKEERESQARREKEEFEARERAEIEERMELERIEQAKEARAAREQVAREEELRRQREENERRERQRQADADAHAREQERQRALYVEQEKQRREDQERRRAQLQEQQRAERIRIEKEKKLERLAKLPLLLRWLDTVNDPKTPDIASLFRFIEGFRYDTIKPEATGKPTGREQWMLNTHVALLLGEKDLQLSRCKLHSYNHCFYTDLA